MPVAPTIFDPNASPTLTAVSKIGLPWMTEETNSPGPGDSDTIGSRDGNAADRRAVAVKKNISTWILMCTKDAVGSVRIIDMQAQEEIALGIEAIQLVKAFRHLFVAKAALGPQRSRRSANSILVHEHVRLV